MGAGMIRRGCGDDRCKDMLLLTHSDDQAIRQRLAADLTEVEARFGAELISDLPCVNSLITHVERYRGKMLRPSLVLLAGMASAPNQEELTDAHLLVATVVELVHMATLVHDDILDEAQVRRGGGTINHLRGNEAAVMLGDYLISHAYHLCSSLDSTLASRVIAEATNTVCEGELLQLANRGNGLLDEQTYFQIIRLKTGSLCGSCCRLGAMLNGARAETVDDLCDYGENLGVAFQIVDDLLDVVGTERTVGKTLGKDLQKGKLTLPLIHCLGSTSERQRQQLLGLLRVSQQAPPGASPTADSSGADPTDQIRQLITTHGSVDYAYQHASRMIEQAKNALAGVGPSPACSMLMAMADAVLTRKF